MPSIMEQIRNSETWAAFYADRLEKERLSQDEALFFSRLIASGGFLPAAEGIAQLSVPQKKQINKGGAGKKRVVYAYTPEENAVLKVIAHLCYRYDAGMPNNLYSFRRNVSAKTAIRRLASAPGIGDMYAYKLDIRNYFNAIDAARLLPQLRALLWDDGPLYRFFESMLTADAAVSEGRLLHEKRGVMAGTPTSAFLANVFLLPLDRHFEQAGVLYARYSDDIILFAPTQAELDEHRAYLCRTLEEYGLERNPDKERVSLPHEQWTFLGIAYCDGRIDISENTANKLKGKIRRKARALYRWKTRKGATGQQAARAFIRSINRKLYEESDDGRHFSWTRWFFPLLTTSDSLHMLDAYIQQYMRYVYSGGFGRSNYRVRYEDLKACGFRPLVAAYYQSRQPGAHPAGGEAAGET